MSKSWSLFSILVVFALLILLAPAVILLPGENVAQGQVNVVQEVEANFSLTEDSGGAWSTFTAGEYVIDAPGLGLTQFGRENVVKSTSLAGCQYRNYTTGSGNVFGALTGSSISLAWQTLKFNEPYSGPGDLYYVGATDFGFITGRGIIADGGDSFTFVFIADFDSDEDMTNFAGKGFMVSVEENGIFGDMSDPPEQRHKIIGDFEINKTGAAYSGNFHLRNYDPSEVFDLGILNVTGGVLTEEMDNITKGLELVNMTVDTPMSTPTDDFTGFEDIAWGKDPTKQVNFGHLGGNGTMDISRNSVIYLTYNPEAGPPTKLWVNIQGTAACNLLIDDTYNVTTDDGTCHGKLWEFLVLSLPWQNQSVHTPPNFFGQSGYTWTSFRMLNPSTESYAGTESFALAEIFIEATTVNAQQYSDDWAYGLYPHPKVESINPNTGYVGETLDVTIKGKYFLRAGPDAPGASVSLGPNITVNSWSLKDSSPIDNEITARITIGSSAGTTEEDVTVTSCFNYDNATIRQYMSGVLNGFTVKALEGDTIQGQVSYDCRTKTPLQWVQVFDVKVFENGTVPFLDNELWNGTAITDSSGGFVISNLTLPAGTYDIGVKNDTCLSELQTGEDLTTPVGFGTTREGDVQETDKVDGVDFSYLSGSYNLKAGEVGFVAAADLNRSGKVDGVDFSLLSGNYNVKGSARPHFT